MTISGNVYRNLMRQNYFSADLGLIFQNNTGLSEFGFSGQSKVYKFSFISGKILDHENRYFSSYLPNSFINISTNFSGVSYDYSVNGDKVLYSGSKQNFYAENFYFKTTGCNIEALLSIKSDKPSVSLVVPNYFYTGQLITGYVVSSSASGIKLHTGYFENSSSFYFDSLPTGYITSSSSGQVLIGQNVTGLGNFNSKAYLTTTAGDYDQTIITSGVSAPYLNYIFEIDQGSNTLNNLANISLASGDEKVGFVNLNYSFDTNYDSLVPASLPLDISLSYYSGVTGQYGQISDVTITSGGKGYLSAPTIIFSGGFCENIAKALSAASNYFLRSDGKKFTFGSGQPIAFYTPSGSVLPSPLVENQTYYVTTLFPAAPPYFTISATNGGPMFDITNTGTGNFYFYDPTRLASGTALLGSTSLDYDSVVDIVMTNYGSGYSCAPTVIFSGGTGIINNLTPTLASGYAEISAYVKSITGFFDLSTGDLNGLVSYRDSSFVSNGNYSKTGFSLSDSSNVNIQVSYTPSFDQDILVAKLTLSGVNGNLIQKYITGSK